MPNLALITTFLRELIVERTLPREPEPDLVMDDPDQVAAYVEAGRIDGVMAASYLFHTARVSQVIQGCDTVLDLGCGPATQLAQIAGMNPDIRFTGIDLSSTMLANAEKHAASLGLANIQLRQGDITKLEGIADHSIDAVISTMALHHLPTLQQLEDCFASIRRVLKPGGALYLTDFGRLKSLKSAIFFAYLNAKHQPHLFSLDYERSLRAAFLKEEFEALATKHFPPEVRVVSTFKVPFLMIIKTADQPLQEHLRQRFIIMRKALKPRYRRDLNDMRTFFALGGLHNDPFA
ncbi:class I SAM-dependent methyltransferase [Candidatus Nitrotoga arctica]|uniref:Phthiotriol/phenolphthiotriol dimycocerosates methyltransferase n=1 Tax=Candidatus Nitrotoga arctica TaxID=453162 RepID=A0ABN8AN64_9PROT|nr:class I SAM-dependent methyltransferase [Candidatus Nitrotoga arctica]CAG9933477.1 Phthiotriol/phenolphthiotriol dimycocerosates methyltransferase [Candidatus Nitrotoga arctica]